MKITFIKPNIGRLGHSLYIDEGRMEPLQLGVLAGMTPDDFDVVLYDDRMEEIPFDEQTDLVAITVETYTARRAYEIGAEYKRRGIPVVMGGMHATLLPEEVSEHTDTLYVGDGEFEWQTLLSDFKNGKMKKLYKTTSGIPQPGTFTRRDIYKGKGYLPITLLQFGRGCRFACNFCAIATYFDKTQYVRKIDEVLEEIDRQDRDFLFFVDDNINSNHELAKEFYRELISMKVKWVSQTSIDITNDLELMDLMIRSGCLGNVIGFESITKNSLKEMKKAPSFIVPGDDYKPQLEILRDYGHQTWASFTLGHDHDTLDSIKATLDFAMENKFIFGAFNILMPYPNTPLHKKLKDENRLLYDGKWWLHPDYRFNHASFLPIQMTPDELTDATFYLRSKFNSIMSIAKRALDFKTNLRTPIKFGMYITYNPLYRKETFKKQGMHFGKEQ